MKYFLLFLLILFISCNKENPYKKELETYIKEDITYRNNRINFFRQDLLSKKALYPRKYKDMATFALDTIEPLYAKFNETTLNSNNINTINQNLKTLNIRLKKHLDNYKLVHNFFDDFPPEIKDINEKYNLFRRVKESEQKFFSNLILGHLSFHTDCGFYQPTSVFPFRVNDSTIIMNISDKFVTENREYFDDEGFSINKLTDKTMQHIKNKQKEKFCFTSYTIHSKSDTLHLKASLRSNENIGIIASEFDSLIIVGERSYFKMNTEIYDFINCTPTKKQKH